jgi:hypothetical protein
VPCSTSRWTALRYEIILSHGCRYMELHLVAYLSLSLRGNWSDLTIIRCRAPIL